MKLQLQTDKTFTDITDMIKVEEGFNGLINIFSTHTTAGIRILENEKLLLADYQRVLDQFAPKDGFYGHNIIDARDVPPDERLNGHSHIRTLFFPTSETIPIIDGKMQLGKWQRIFLVELDQAREREVIITFLVK